MEIAPGIYTIEGTVGPRPLQLFLLKGTLRTVLLDTGCAPDPERIIFPYLETLGLRPTDVGLIINTHPDLDHSGGNHAFKAAHPRVLLSCGDSDRELIENRQVMWERRYNAYAAAHGLAYGDASRQWIFDMLGQPQQVDFTWRGGETLRLSPDWTVEIHHTPGHSPGHLSVFDPRSGVMCSGDAVQGAVYLDVAGQPVLCPTYLHVETYLATVRYFESLPIKYLATCHWPIKTGTQIGKFLDETRAFVSRAEHLLLQELRTRPAGASLKHLIEAVGPQLGSWPRESDAELMYALAGNLDHLVATSTIVEIDSNPKRYKLTGKPGNK